MRNVLCLSFIAMLSGCALRPPVPPPPPPPVQFIIPPGTEAASDLFGYSQAVRIGPWIMVSGQVGFDLEKFGFPDAFEDQVRLAFKNLEAVLKASGAELRHVVDMTTYQLDMAKFNLVVDIRNEVFEEHRPAWTPLGVSALALPSVQFTIRATAYVPLDGRAAVVVPLVVPAVPPAAVGQPAEPAKPLP